MDVPWNFKYFPENLPPDPSPPQTHPEGGSQAGLWMILLDTFRMILLQKLTESTESLQRHIWDVSPVSIAPGWF